MARIYLEKNDHYTVANSATIFGSTGNETVTILSGVTGVNTDSTIETVELSEPISVFVFKQLGVSLEVYKNGILVTVFDSPIMKPIFDGQAKDINYSGGIMKLGDQLISQNTVIETASSTDGISLTADTTAVSGVEENFIYAIDSSSGSVVSELTQDITLSNFTVGEDTLSFQDSSSGTVTASTFADSTIVSSSIIVNQTDIIFDENSNGDAYQLTLAGVVDSDLSTVNLAVI